MSENQGWTYKPADTLRDSGFTSCEASEQIALATGEEFQARMADLLQVNDPSRDRSLTTARFLGLGFINRVVSLHEGAVMSIQANNSAATYAVLRGLLETAACIQYCIDDPKEIESFVHGRATPLSVGRLTSHAQIHKSPFEDFQRVYAQLSLLVHPSQASLMHGIEWGTSGGFKWTLKPRFAEDGEKIRAWAWCADFTYSCGELLPQYWSKRCSSNH